LRVVSVSLRGHGDSSKPSSGYSIEDLTSDVVPLLDALAIDRALVVGHSGSCLVARRAALQAPTRVAGLVLEASPTTLRGDPKLQEFVTSVVSKLTDPIDLEFARSFVADTSTDDLAAELVELLVEDLLKVPVRVWQEMFVSLVDYDDMSELPLVEAPTLLVWGDADPLIPRSMQDELVRVLPRAELVVYRGVGHTPRWEEPVRFAEHITTFASQLSA
jgi:pimeloyl-ACP methyl ester carboxylesterase